MIMNVNVFVYVQYACVCVCVCVHALERKWLRATRELLAQSAGGNDGRMEPWGEGRGRLGRDPASI